MSYDFRAEQVRTNKLIASGSTGTNALLLIYPVSADGTPANQGNINSAVFNTSFIGQDVFLYVSGAKNTVGTSVKGASVFGGDVVVSGNFLLPGVGLFSADSSMIQLFGRNNAQRPAAQASLSGSLFFSRDTGFLSFVDQSATWITFGKKQYQFVAGYTNTTNTQSNPVVCGQTSVETLEVPTDIVTLRVVLSTTTGSAAAAVKLWNTSSGSYVHIGGEGIVVLTSSLTTPTKIDSVNLRQATNWSLSSSCVYELQLYSSDIAQTAILGSAQFVFGA